MFPFSGTTFDISASFIQCSSTAPTVMLGASVKTYPAGPFTESMPACFSWAIPENLELFSTGFALSYSHGLYPYSYGTLYHVELTSNGG